jgi:tripartite ATP-independent transporter DctP family solute receptor
MKFMKKQKSFLVIFVMALFIATLSACSSTKDTAGSESKQKATDEVFTLRVTNTVTDDHASNIAWKEIIPEIEEKSNGRLKIELFTNGQLFASDREAVEAVQMKNVEITEIASSTLATFNPKFTVFDLPFLFLSREAAYKAQDGELGKTLNDELPKMNLVGLGYGENGFRHFLNDKHPIEKPSDFSKLKIRVIESKLYEDIFKSLGANASPLAFGEVYTALQQGVFDGMDQPISLIATMKFNEVQKYLTLSGHTYSPTITLINKEVFGSMPDELQNILKDSIGKFSQRQRELTVQQDEKELEKLKETMKINELSTKQKDEFIKVLEPIYDDYRDIVGEDLIEIAKREN